MARKRQEGHNGGGNLIDSLSHGDAANDISDLLNGVTRAKFNIAPDFPRCAERSLMHIHQHISFYDCSGRSPTAEMTKYSYVQGAV